MIGYECYRKKNSLRLLPDLTFQIKSLYIRQFSKERGIRNVREECRGAHRARRPDHHGEIAQQPELWRDTLNIYRENKEAIEAFLAEARAMGEGRLSVVFTGAGTSDYVGDTCAPYLRHAGNTDLYDFKPIATTDIVSAPRDFLRAEDPTLVVSFARSGNSPESLAAVAVAKELVHNVKFLNITCAPEGKLAVESADDPNALTLLIPRANDKASP